MADNPPGYDLADRLLLSTPDQVRALGHPLRRDVLQLLHERAASVTELAAATGRPKGTVAHHVDTLVRAGLARVVRTRRVRATEERFYGRTARTFVVEQEDGGDPLPRDFNDFEVAARESAAAHEQGRLQAFIRHARISGAERAEFWDRIVAVVEEFDRLPRSGDRVYGFAIGIYPTDGPALPTADTRED